MHQNQVRQVKIKAPHGTVLKFIEQAVCLFNRHQLLGGGECQTVKKMFKKVGQSLWYRGGWFVCRTLEQAQGECAFQAQGEWQRREQFAHGTWHRKSSWGMNYLNLVLVLFEQFSS